MMLHESIAFALNRRLLNEDKSEWLEIHEQSIINFSWRYAYRWQRSHWLVVGDALRDWLDKQQDARAAVGELTSSNKVVGIWIANQIVREKLTWQRDCYGLMAGCLDAAQRWVVDPSEDNRLKCDHAVKFYDECEQCKYINPAARFLALAAADEYVHGRYIFSAIDHAIIHIFDDDDDGDDYLIVTGYERYQIRPDKDYIMSRESKRLCGVAVQAVANAMENLERIIAK